DRLPEVALARLIDLADDGVIPDVFLDRVLEGFGHGSGQLLSRAKLRASRTGVSSHLVLVRHDGLFRQDLQYGVLAVRERSQRVFHDAILERMKRDHDQPRADPQPPRGSLEKPIESLELAIH